MIRILPYSETNMQEIFARVTPAVDVKGIVKEIIQNVVTRGDAALYEYCERFDRAKLTALEVTTEEIEEAFLAAKATLSMIATAL